jgi:CRISPR system Cascade subunit CasD
MQSWGTTSRFDERDTGKEPSKSGVIGLVAAALGIDRDNCADLEPLARLALGVRHDRPGVPKRDYQTAGCAATDSIIKADGTQAKDGGVVSQRFYLADAAFLVGLEGTDRPLLEKVHAALLDPVWPLALGRKSYVPSEPGWMKDGLQDRPLCEVLTSWPWIGMRRPAEEPPTHILLSMDSSDGSGALRMDQPLSSFAERRFGARFVRSEWIPCPKGVTHVAA